MCIYICPYPSTKNLPSFRSLPVKLRALPVPFVSSALLPDATFWENSQNPLGHAEVNIYGGSYVFPHVRFQKMRVNMCMTMYINTCMHDMGVHVGDTENIVPGSKAYRHNIIHQCHDFPPKNGHLVIWKIPTFFPHFQVSALWDLWHLRHLAHR